MVNWRVTGRVETLVHGESSLEQLQKCETKNITGKTV